MMKLKVVCSSLTRHDEREALVLFADPILNRHANIIKLDEGRSCGGVSDSPYQLLKR